MVAVQVKITGLEKYRTAFAASPMVLVKWLSRAVRSGIFLLIKEMGDDNWRFVTPRGARTGRMAISVREKIFFAKLYGSVGPNVEYANDVYRFHLNRGNNFLQRFIDGARPAIEKRFDRNLNKALKEIGKKASS